MQDITVSARNLEDAITEAMVQLGVTSDQLEYDVIEKGSEGFFGFGRKQAVIRAWRKSKPEEMEDIVIDFSDAINGVKKSTGIESRKESRKEKEEALAGKTRDNKKKKNKNRNKNKKERQEPAAAAASEVKEKEEVKAPAKEKAPVKEKTPEKDIAPEKEKPAAKERLRNKEKRQNRENRENKEKKDMASVKEQPEEKAPVKEKPERKEIVLARPEEETITACIKFLKDVMAAMDMDVEIVSSIDEEGALVLEMDGDNMGILIGKRGQTLDSLQYLTNRVANKMQDGYVRVKLDTEDYRRRRKETLENLAKNIAHKVKRTRRNVSLEPMNPYERRIIHSALQTDKSVSTHSEGEEPYRRVVVTLVRK